jgi:hypothetical protein
MVVVLKFLRERNITQRSVFEKRFKESGLNEMKKQKVPYKDAVAKYDSWFSDWKAALAEKQKINGAKALSINTDFAETNVEKDDRKETNRNAENDGDKNTDVKQEDDDTTNNKAVPSNKSKIFDGNSCGHSEDESEDDSKDESEDDSKDESEGECNVDKDSDSDSSNNNNTDKEEYNHDASNAKKKARGRKLSVETMKTIMTELYVRPISPYSILKEKNVIGNKNSVYRHWKQSGLPIMKEDGVHLARAMSLYDLWRADQRKKSEQANRKNGSLEKAIPVALEKFMHELIKQLALCGQGVGKKIASKVFEEAMKEWGVNHISRSTLNRFVHKYDLECRVVKNIDPARIAQVTPENRDAFFFRLNQVVALLHDLDPDNCPSTCWKDVDSKFIDNVDEMGSDNTQHRDVLLIPKEVTQRLFQSTPEGDKSHRHVTVVVFSKSNGWYKDDAANISGAAPPMIIHSKPSMNKDKGASAIDKRMRLYEAGEDDDIIVDQSYLDGITPGNPLGLTIRTSTNGSMTKELFLDLVLHYVRHLGPEQGPRGKYTFLLTDSHVSRWHPKALFILMKNRVIPLYFPSHLSIVVQPQDNGVILFLHKCIEETVSNERLFRSDTPISYINSSIERAFILFRDTERKKLIDRGSNSTTRSYRVTGMKPCNPFAIGWRENLELYASFNGLRMESQQCPYYGIRPKNKSTCPYFSEVDIGLLNKAVPLLARGDGDDDATILDDPKTKCYAVANEIITNWIEKPYGERAVRPRAATAVEKLAWKHMDITHIVATEPVSVEATMLLDSKFNQIKRSAILGQTKANECIQVCPKDEEDSPWFTAVKMLQPDNMWHVFDGLRSQSISTLEIDEKWTVNMAYDMFPNDRRLKKSRWRSSRRRREEKDRVIQSLAKTVAEEERDGELKQLFNKFMERPSTDQTFAEFKEFIVTKIETPSEHAVTVALGSEEHTIKVSAHGDNLCPMSRLVMENICRTLVCVAARSEKKTCNRRRGGKVVSVKRGSDGFQKILQIDQQHQQDQIQEAEQDRRTKKAKLLECQRRLKEIRRICLIRRYQSIWNHDDRSLICRSNYLTKLRLISFLKAYNVEGRTSLYKKSREIIETKLKEMNINQSSFEKMEEDLLEELRVLGGVDDFQVDQSFDSSMFEESDSSGEERNQAVGILLESEAIPSEDLEDSSNGTDDLDSLDSGNNGKMVSFNDNPTIYHIPRRSLHRQQKK